MADQVTSATRPNPRNLFAAKLAATFATLPWWLQVLLAWAATRAVSTLAFLWAATKQGPSYWYNWSNPNYLDFVNIWDVEWYFRIFKFGLGQLPGYSPHLPLNALGGVEQNAWAFMPGFPMLVRGVDYLFGNQLEWHNLAPWVSLALSFVLAIIVYQVFRLKLNHRTSLWAVTLLGFYCASPVLQTGYAETLGLVFLSGGLYFLIQHRYLASLPFLMGLSITRPGMVAFALSLAGMWLVRFIKSKRGTDEFPTPERFKLALLTAASTLLGFAWPLFAWWYTGRADAYTATELAWRTADPNAEIAPFMPWVQMAVHLLGPIFGVLGLTVFVGGMVWLLTLPSMKHLGNELRLWVASYLLYLLLVFNPQSSTFRILLPAFPLLGVLALKTVGWNRWIKALVLVVLALLQCVWLLLCWVHMPPDITPP